MTVRIQLNFGTMVFNMWCENKVQGQHERRNVFAGNSPFLDYLVTSAKFFPINDSTCSDTAIRFHISSAKFGFKGN